MRGLLDFILSKAMLKAIAGIGLAWIVILSFTWCGMSLNSRPWSERIVPGVEGLMKDSAFKILEELDLMPIHLDSVYNSSAVPATIPFLLSRKETGYMGFTKVNLIPVKW